MPITRAELPMVRETLLRLTAEYGLSSTKLLDLFDKARSEHNQSVHIISRATLDRLKIGQEVNKIAELSALWDFLETHSDYSRVCREERERLRRASSAGDAAPENRTFAGALRDFFPEREGTSFPRRNIQRNFPGRYAMYRAPPRSNVGGLVQSSLLEITTTIEGLSIMELQDFADPEYYYYQRDEGHIFPYGKYIYFVMKEVGSEVDNSCVKMAVIKGFVAPRGLVQTFYGILYTSSNLFVYPAAKFICRRADANVKSEVTELSRIPFSDVREYLMEPVLTGRLE